MARTLPYAFSERGILMLSSVFKSQRDIEQSLYIIDYKKDNEKTYRSAASIKDAGKKICTIMQINDFHMIHEMIDELLLHADYLL